MACCGSRGDGMEVSESAGKKKRKSLMENGTRVSKPEAKKRKTRIKKSHKKKSTKKKNRRQVSEEELKERELILGGTVVAYERDDPNRCFLGERLKSLVNLAIDLYNKNNSTDYRMVYLVRAIYESCQGALYYMTMTAKLPNQDDADAITFEAEVYQGIPDTIIVIRFVRVLLP